MRKRPGKTSCSPKTSIRVGIFFARAEAVGTVPRSLQAGEVESVYLIGQLHERDDEWSPEDYARAVADLDKLAVTVSWTYMRSDFPRRLRRVESPPAEQVTIDPWRFATGLRQTWAQDPSLIHLVELSEPAED